MKQFPTLNFGHKHAEKGKEVAKWVGGLTESVSLKFFPQIHHYSSQRLKKYLISQSSALVHKLQYRDLMKVYLNKNRQKPEWITKCKANTDPEGCERQSIF